MNFVFGFSLLLDMRKKLKIALWISLSILLLIAIASLVLNRVFESKIRAVVEDSLPKGIVTNNYNLTLSTFRGHITAENIIIKRKSANDISGIELEQLSLNGLSYWKLLVSNTISFKEVSVSNVNITMNRNTSVKEKFQGEPPKAIIIKNFHAKNINVTLLDDSLENSYLEVNNFSVSLKNIRSDENLRQKKIPFEFENIDVYSGFISYHLNPYDVLSVKEFSLHNHQFSATDLAIKTIYGKEELSTIITTERDYIDLLIPVFTIDNFRFGNMDVSFFIANTAVHLENATLDIYRDKLVEDDLSVKPLYSKSIRELPFYLTVDSLFLNNTTIVYEEKVHPGHSAGRINFSELNAKIGNVSNTYLPGEKKTTIDITANFMDNSPLKVHWEFDANNTQDFFTFRGELGELNTTKMNKFTKPNLNVDLEGEIHKTYFVIHGNDDESQIDLSLNYNNLKVEIYDNHDKRNRLLSAVANLFVKKDSDTKDRVFKDGKGTAKRNKDKSFFNYLWINLQSGLKDVIIAI